MAFTVKYLGVEIECPTATDVAALFQQLPTSRNSSGTEPTTSKDNPPVQANPLTPRYAQFMRSLDGKQKNFLNLLMQSAEGKTDDSIRKVLGIGNNHELGGFLSGISKLAKAVGVGPRDIYTKQWIEVHGLWMREYKLSQDFRDYAVKLGGIK